MIYDLSSFTNAVHVANLGHTWYAVACVIAIVVSFVHLYMFLYADTKLDGQIAYLKLLTVLTLVGKYHVALFLAMVLLKGALMLIGVADADNYMLFGFSVLTVTLLMWS